MRISFLTLSAALVWSSATLAQSPAFEAKPVGKMTKTTNDKPVTYPQSGTPEVTALFITIEPNGHSRVHRHENGPAIGYVMEGSVEFRTDDKIKKVSAGETFVEPTGDDWVQLWNTGTSVTRIITFIIGVEGMPTSVAKQ